MEYRFTTHRATDHSSQHNARVAYLECVGAGPQMAYITYSMGQSATTKAQRESIINFIINE